MLKGEETDGCRCIDHGTACGGFHVAFALSMLVSCAGRVTPIFAVCGDALPTGCGGGGGLRLSGFSRNYDHQQEKLICTRRDKLKMVQRNKLIMVQQNKLM